MNVGNDTILDNSGKMIGDSRGNYLCSGWSFDLDTGNGATMLLNKIDSSGNLIFEKHYPANPFANNYVAASVTQTSDHGYILVGSKYPDATPFVPSTDLYYIKTDSDGNQLWSKQISNNGTDLGYDV